MPIYRVIFRLDFEPVYDIFDYPGKIMKELHTKKMGGTTLLPELLEQSDRRIVTAKFTSKKKDEMRSLSVEPVSIHGTLETIGGIEVGRLNDYDVFTKLVQLTDTIRRDYSINDLVRCGLRLFIFDTIDTQNEGSSLDKVKSLMNQEVTNKIQIILGNISDAGIGFDGISEEDIFYKLRCGPYSTQGSDNYLSVIGKLFDENIYHDFIVDVDLYEKNFRLNKDVSFKKWCEPAIKKASDLINLLTTLLV